MRSLIGMTFLNSSVGQRRLRQNGIVLRLGPVVADRRRATLPHRQGHCLDRQDLETLLLWLQRHFLCVPLEHLLEGPAPACLRIALSVDGNPAELAEQVYPLLERYEMPASAFIGGDPRSWREAVAETLWQADATAAGPLLELLEGYSGAALMAVFERTGDDQRRSRNLDLLLRKLERLDPASQQALHAACPVPAPYSAGDWERVRRLENSGLLRFGLRGQEPHPSAGLCAEDCLGRAHRQLQQHCAAPPAGVLPSSYHTRRATRPARRPRSAWLPLRLRRAQWPGGYPLRPAGPAAHRGGCGDRRPSRPAGLAHLSWSPPMSMASSPFPRRRDRQSPSAGRPPEPREANAPSPAMPQRRRSQGYGQPSWPGISKDRPMTADTPTSVATINHLLLGAPYTSPLVIPGDWLVDELEGAVEVGGFTDGLFRWPTRKRSGRPSPILCGDLLRAVRTECAESVQFWWGFSPSLVGRWRRALGVTRRNNPGDQAVARARAALARSLDRKAPPKAPAAWSSEEVEFIRRHGSKRSLAWCAYMLGRSYQSVASKAEELSPHSGRDRNNAIWSKSEEDLLRQHYQQRGSLWCAQQTGKTRAAVFHRAKKLGLQRQRPKHP